MKIISVLFLWIVSFPLSAETLFSKSKTSAEKLFSEKSFSKTQKIYESFFKQKLSEEEHLSSDDERWLKFRVADCSWRSAAATNSQDSTIFDQAFQTLDALSRTSRPEDKDRTWAEVEESLGDFYWTRKNTTNAPAAWPHYNNALDFWAGNKNLDLARERYLRIVWTLEKSSWEDSYYRYGYHDNGLPAKILQNALKIVQTDEDKAHASYLLTTTLASSARDWSHREHMLEAFQNVLNLGKKTQWYDDALYGHAKYFMDYGDLRTLENGSLILEPNYVKALTGFQKLLKEFEKGETRYYEDARRAIESISNPSLSVSVANIFLPNSKIQYFVHWRNIDRIDFSLVAIDLSQDIQCTNKDPATGRFGSAERTSFTPTNWIQEIDTAGKQKVKSWSQPVTNLAHKHGNESFYLNGTFLAPGAYVLEAKAGNLSSRELIVVSDAALLVKTSKQQTLVYFCNAQNGTPIPGATVQLWQRYYSHEDNKVHLREQKKQTDAQGLASFTGRFGSAERTSFTGRFGSAERTSFTFQTQENHDAREFFLGASTKNGISQSFATGTTYHHGSHLQQSWKIYAFTDRPAYRPQETVECKWIARSYDGAKYHTPSQQTLHFQISDPQGNTVSSGKTILNTFGSGWSSLKCTEKMPLGEYRITFWDENHKKNLGSALLFRLEEYKLPEFQVKVSTSQEGKKIFRLGDTVEALIQANTYFGSAVTNASVEVLVTQKPYTHSWRPPQDYPWYYTDLSPYNPDHYGRGQIIKQETLKTDGRGQALITFDTPKNSGQNYSYHIEARVTDSSRREIIGTASVKVTAQSYTAFLHAEHYLYHPKNKITLSIKTLDANEGPVKAEGRIKLSRDQWKEIWITNEGKEKQGHGQAGWTLKSQGYEHEDLLTQSLKTDEKGHAEFSFTPWQEGYYRIVWNSEDKDGSPITAESTVWVASNGTKDLGYRYGGVQILLDKDTVRAGSKVPVMLSVPTQNCHVLFSIETEGIHQYQLVHLNGTVKLLELDITEEHIPNIFLSANLVQDYQLLRDEKQVIVPPVENFLNVELNADKNLYLPRDPGTFTLQVKDHAGQPVHSEISLGVVDESVYSIQNDYAEDPRQFYFGTKRPHTVQTFTTFQNKSFFNPALEKEMNLHKRASRRDGVQFGLAGQKESVERPRESALDSLEKHQKNDSDKTIEFEAKAEAPSKANRQELPSENAVQVRNDFRSTIFWQSDLKTDKEGKARVSIPFADSLTRWKGTCRVASEQNQFGTATLSVQTRKPLIARLQAPRFFLVGDSTTVSVVINNNTDEPLDVVPGLQVEGLVMREEADEIKTALVSIPPHGEARKDWVLSAQKEGKATIKAIVRHTKYSDAMEKSYPIFEHGIEQILGKSGKTQKEKTEISLFIPKERKKESTKLSVHISPSLAVTLLDALPYLIDYPYGCTEQTMSRFLPAVIVHKTLKELGLKSEDIQSKIFGGIEKEFIEKTHPQGAKNLSALPEMIAQCLDRLYDFQHSDGGWGWWKEGESDPFMSAYVLWGLSLTRSAQIEIRSPCIESAAKYLNEVLVEKEDALDTQAWIFHALASYHACKKNNVISEFQKKAFKNLWTQREKLNAYSRALLALSAWHLGYKTEAKTLVENLENGITLDTTPDSSVLQKDKNLSETEGTAHWGSDSFWHWSEGSVETTAFALQALLTIDPQNKQIAPIVNWLIKNRRGAQWSNTRDTAFVILSMVDYLKTSGELKSELEYTLEVNGKSIVTQKITPKETLRGPSIFRIDPTLLVDGNNSIRILKKEKTPLYFSAQVRFFNQQEPIPSAGHEIFAKRQYYKIVEHPTLLKGTVYEKIPLSDGGIVKSGERLETIITLETKNNYEYLVFEDLKPAGLEAVQIKSGEPLCARALKSGPLKTHLDPSKQSDEQDYSGQTRNVYQELRDRKTTFFIDKLSQGFWEIRYELRAETPGTFHALPLLGHAMYVPEIRCNGDEIRIAVQD
jgi:uncharacterized protein YfaS (alpha-2-macroglobulin family)